MQKTRKENNSLRGKVISLINTYLPLWNEFLFIPLKNEGGWRRGGMQSYKSDRMIVRNQMWKSRKRHSEGRNSNLRSPFDRGSTSF